MPSVRHAETRPAAIARNRSRSGLESGQAGLNKACLSAAASRSARLASGVPVDLSVAAGIAAEKSCTKTLVSVSVFWWEQSFGAPYSSADARSVTPTCHNLEPDNHRSKNGGFSPPKIKVKDSATRPIRPRARLDKAAASRLFKKAGQEGINMKQSTTREDRLRNNLLEMAFGE